MKDLESDDGETSDDDDDDDDDDKVDEDEKEKEKMEKAQRSLIKMRIRKPKRKLMNLLRDLEKDEDVDTSDLKTLVKAFLVGEEAEISQELQDKKSKNQFQDH